MSNKKISLENKIIINRDSIILISLRNCQSYELKHIFSVEIILNIKESSSRIK